jgi:hypothetical protein
LRIEREIAVLPGCASRTTQAAASSATRPGIDWSSRLFARVDVSDRHAGTGGAAGARIGLPVTPTDRRVHLRTDARSSFADARSVGVTTHRAARKIAELAGRARRQSAAPASGASVVSARIWERAWIVRPSVAQAVAQSELMARATRETEGQGCECQCVDSD